MTFAIKTLGCKVNIYETNVIIEQFVENGYRQVDFKEKADVYVINTCVVTNNALKKSNKMIKRSKKLNPNAIRVVTGCLVNYEEAVDASIVVGNNHKTEIINLVKNYKNKQTIKTSLNNVLFEPMIVKTPPQTRAFVKIQDGCNNYCSYCIIPYVRGRERSKALADVIFEISELINKNYQEIVLTGINIGAYGKDIGTSFNFLLEKILKIKDLKRLRISSIEITEVDEVFLKILKNKIIVNHLHIPLQSGSNQILKKMNRKYDIEYYINQLEKIKKIRPNINLTTDLIVGFPGETDDDFQQSVSLIKKINFSNVHYFPYSKRELTTSSTEIGLDKEIILKRTLLLEKEIKKLKKQHLLSLLKKEVAVLFEQKKDNYYFGHTDDYYLVKIKSNQCLLNKIIDVKIKTVEDFLLIGEERVK